jgi:hypothetical protein
LAAKHLKEKCFSKWAFEIPHLYLGGFVRHAAVSCAGLANRFTKLAFIFISNF